MQAILIHLNLSGYSYQDINEVVLIEMIDAKILHYTVAQDLLKAVGTTIKIRIAPRFCDTTFNISLIFSR